MDCNCKNTPPIYLCGECGDTLGFHTQPTGEIVLSCTMCKSLFQELQLEADYYQLKYEELAKTKYDHQ